MFYKSYVSIHSFSFFFPYFPTSSIPGTGFSMRAKEASVAGPSAWRPSSIIGWGSATLNNGKRCWKTSARWEDGKTWQGKMMENDGNPGSWNLGPPIFIQKTEVSKCSINNLNWVCRTHGLVLVICLLSYFTWFCAECPWLGTRMSIGWYRMVKVGVLPLFLDIQKSQRCSVWRWNDGSWCTQRKTARRGSRNLWKSVVLTHVDPGIQLLQSLVINNMLLSAADMSSTCWR